MIFLFFSFGMSFLGKKEIAPKERSIASLAPSVIKTFPLVCNQLPASLDLTEKGTIQNITFNNQNYPIQFDPIVKNSNDLVLELNENNQLICYPLSELLKLTNSYSTSVIASFEDFQSCFELLSKKKGFFFSFWLSPRVESWVIFNSEQSITNSTYELISPLTHTCKNSLLKKN